MSDSEFMMKEITLSRFDIGKNIEKLSVRYRDHPTLFLKQSFMNEYNNYKQQKNGNSNDNNNSNGGATNTMNTSSFDFTSSMNNDLIRKIKNREELDFLFHNFLDNITNAEYELKDICKFVMILPEQYYEEGSYSKWIRVLWVLKNTSNKLLILWIAFCARAKKFQFSSIPDECDRWENTEKRNIKSDTDKNDSKILTKRSLINWVKTDAKEEYEKIRKESITYFIEETINKSTECGDWDLANVLYQMNKYKYVCVSVKSNIWYQYKNHRWQEIDSGTTLRKYISMEMRDEYFKLTMSDMVNVSTAQIVDDLVQSAEPKKENKKTNRQNSITNIYQRLSKTSDKKNIMTEAKELFYDGTFLEKMDTNPYLLCFKNGVFDFKEKIFRNGNPEDNISMCTNIKYVELNPKINQSIMNEINDFMDKLFPEKELCQYMWDHLASCMLGTSSNQTFNIYIGIGQNGKSVLVNLMEKVLGDYKGDVPLTLVTDKRGKVGGLAPEIVQLKGKRFAVMQEPSKGDRINEGIMKQLTSGKDPIQGRAPYMPQTISFIPQFNLVVTANVFMEIKSNDHGTWRRIRAVPFKSLFTENPVDNDPEKPYQYKLDKHIDEKFDSWKEVFASMLVARACQTEGAVKDCSIVLAKSNEYRKSQDYISEFVDDRLIRDKNSRLRKTDLNQEFAVWYMGNYGGKSPSPKDLHEYMDKEFSRQRDGCWYGVTIKYDKKTTTNDDNTTIDSDNYEEELNEIEDIPMT
jgi:P4 family phage/plasmid primase-like protien